ncbi:DNA-binding protein [Salinibius halmophilus]|uniref:DNA-binding protein n=1 Tax=Salinibius halmophilus TaxID=1853216 RepID=UPI000E66133A|nr:DNA-binding protein [Salinibius halmophilus]
MKRIATLDAVFDACNELEEAGIAWDRDDVRAKIGGGSYSVIEPLIKTWREHAALTSALPEMQAELLLGLSAWLKDRFNQQIEQLTDELRSNFSELEQDNTTLARDNEQLTQQVLELQQQLDTEQSETQQQIKVLQAQVDSLGEENEQLLSRLDDAELLQSQLEEEHEAELANQQQTFATQSHIKDQTISALQAHIASIEQEAEATKAQSNQHTEQLRKQSSELEEMRQTLASQSQAHMQALHQLELEGLAARSALQSTNQQLESEANQLKALLARTEKERELLLSKLLKESSNDTQA